MKAPLAVIAVSIITMLAGIIWSPSKDIAVVLGLLAAIVSAAQLLVKAVRRSEKRRLSRRVHSLLDGLPESERNLILNLIRDLAGDKPGSDAASRIC